MYSARNADCCRADSVTHEAVVVPEGRRGREAVAPFLRKQLFCVQAYAVPANSCRAWSFLLLNALRERTFQQIFSSGLSVPVFNSGLSIVKPLNPLRVSA